MKCSDFNSKGNFGFMLMDFWWVLFPNSFRSHSRCTDNECPKKKKARSLSIPNQIKLSLLNAGFIGNWMSADKHRKIYSAINIFFLWIFHQTTDEGKISEKIVLDRPTDVKTFLKNCQHRRKYPILYKVEFNVSFLQLKLSSTWNL